MGTGVSPSIKALQNFLNGRKTKQKILAPSVSIFEYSSKRNIPRLARCFCQTFQFVWYRAITQNVNQLTFKYRSSAVHQTFDNFTYRFLCALTTLQITRRENKIRPSRLAKLVRISLNPYGSYTLRLSRS